MRVSIARIRLYLKTGKKLSDGTSPIMLMCSFSGRKGVLIRTMLMFNLSGDYFLPTLCGYEGNNYRKRVNNIYSYHSEHLVQWFREVNQEIVKRNVESGDTIPLIDLECRYYSYRHSYIMKEIQKPNVNLLALAQRVGKSSHTLHQYISLLGDVDLID